MKAGLKKRFFMATGESILLYGCESWTIAQETSLNGTYTERMLRKALNFHWSSHNAKWKSACLVSYQQSDKIASRRLQLEGHCHRHPELSTKKLELWEPTHGHRGRGRPQSSNILTLKRGTGAGNTGELATFMEDRKILKPCGVPCNNTVRYNFRWVFLSCFMLKILQYGFCFTFVQIIIMIKDL